MSTYVIYIKINRALYRPSSHEELIINVLPSPCALYKELIYNGLFARALNFKVFYLNLYCKLFFFLYVQLLTSYASQAICIYVYKRQWRAAEIYYKNRLRKCYMKNFKISILKAKRFKSTLPIFFIKKKKLPPPPPTFFSN